MKICFFCAEKIKDAALKCRFCGEWLTASGTRPTFQENKEKDISKNDEEWESIEDFNIDIDENFIEVQAETFVDWAVYRLAGHDYLVRKQSLIEQKKTEESSPANNSHVCLNQRSNENSSHRNVLDIVQLLYAGMGKELSADNKSLCLKKGDILSFQEDPCVVNLFYDVLKGFFHMASRGEIFLPEESLKERFGYSIRLKYPEANRVFLDFAKTYWTFKILLEEKPFANGKGLGEQLLLQVQENIGSVFFPDSGVSKISWQGREKEQKRYIKMSGADISLEEFMEGNAVLLRDKLSQKGVFSRIFNI